MKLSHVLAFCLILRALYSIPLDGSLPGGVDTASHLFKAWSISEFGLTYWSPHWYLGFPLISHYPPLLYLIAGSLGRLIDHLLAYKILLDLFFISSPLAFLSLLREIEPDNKVRSLALLIFSLSPIYIYYLYDGRHPAMAALFFGLLFWKYLISYEKTASAKDLIASSFMLALGILTHHLTSLFVIIAVFGYYITNKKCLIVTAKTSAIAFLISSPWSLPFLFGGFGNNATRVVSPSLEMAFATQVISSSYVHAYSHPMTPFFVLALGIVLVYFSFVHLRKGVDSFVFSLAVLIVSLFVFSYNRAFIVMPIPLAILAARGMRGTGKPFIAILALLLIGSYHMVQVSFPYPDVPLMPQNERVVFLTKISENAPYYESYLIPYGGAFYALGWHPESQTPEKTAYNRLLETPKSPEGLYSLMEAGGVGYVAGNDNLKDFLAYSKSFKLKETRGGISVFEAIPKPSYAENNGKAVEMMKGLDVIKGTFQCERGEIIIKESFHPSWQAEINGKRVDIGKTGYGLIQIENANEGRCDIELRYRLFSAPGFGKY